MATVGLLIAIPALVTWLNDQLVNIFDFGIPRELRRHPGGAAARHRAHARRSTGRCPFDVPFDSNQLVVFVSAVVVAVGLWLLLRHTPLGLQMRAVVDRADLAEHPRHQRAHHVALRLGDRHDAGGARRRRRRADHRVARLPAGFITVTFVATAAAVLGGLRSIPLAFARWPAARRRREPRGRLRRLREGHQRLQQLGAVHPAAGRSRGDGPRPKPPGWFDRRRDSRRPTTSPTCRCGGGRSPGRSRPSFLIVYILFLANDFWVGVIAIGPHPVADLPVVRRGHRHGRHGEPRAGERSCSSPRSPPAC